MSSARSGPRTRAEPEVGDTSAKWVVRFEADGLEPRDVRMLEELIAGNIGIARMIFRARGCDGDVERQVAESVRDALAADFPSVKFRVERSD